MSTDIYFAKQKLRQKCKHIRNSLDAGFRTKSCQDICDHIADWDVFQKANVVLTYMPMQNEVDLTPLLRCYHLKKWVIPRILPENQMVFQQYDPDKLILHTYGMWEPAPDCPVIPSAEIDLALVPGLAFDAQGWRLGFGGGFYDRFLCNYKGVTLGIAYHSLFLERVVYDSYDIPMRFVVTEKGVKKTGNSHLS